MFFNKRKNNKDTHVSNADANTARYENAKTPVDHSPSEFLALFRQSAKPKGNNEPLFWDIGPQRSGPPIVS